MWSISSLLLFPGPLLPGVVVSVRVLSISQINLIKNYLHLIESYAKKILLRNIYTKNVNMNVQ